MKRNEVLRRIVSLLLILTLITSLFVNLPLSVSAEGEGLQGGQSNIVNGSFEYPYLCEEDRLNKNSGWANVVYDNTVYDPNKLGWKTTATDKRIEYAWLKNTDVPANMSPHMKPVTIQKVDGVAASDGYQFAEVVANKVSSLFQILPVESGENYKWTIHHRGRTEDNDTLAFIIADKNNSVNYGAETQDKSDCFQQIITWMKSQGVTAPAAGEMAKYTVYTTELSDLYSFKPASSGSCFSDSEDEKHTEKFIIYLMSSNKSAWCEYSDNYSLAETEPDKEILFVLSPFSTSFKNSSGAIAVSGGNLVDNISFTDKRGNNRIVNAGFDDVLLKGTNPYTSFFAANAPSPESGIGWSTTASDYYVEVGNIKNGDAYGLGAKITTEIIPPSIRDGEQFAELNASEESSLYQIVSTDPGKMYKWSLSHRGRDYIDTMALIIGPAQFNENGESILPKKTSSTARDQLMQISDWLYSQTEMPLQLPTDGGCSDKIKVYTPKFNSSGGWTEKSNIFSFYKDNTHTEEWSVWVIASKNDKWYDYGELASAAKYSYECVIPAGQSQTIFGFVSHSSLKADGTKNNMSYGNLLDNIAFKEYYYAKVEVAMNNSHGYAYITSGEEDSFIWDDRSQLNGWALQDSSITVHVKPDGRDFIGAYINGVFHPNTEGNDHWEYNAEKGEYYYTFTSVKSAIKVNIIFSAQKIYYDSRSPNEYKYLKVIDEDTGEVSYTGGPEVPMSSGEGDIKEYTSHEPDLTNLDGWKFMGWKYINPADSKVTIFDAEHTVTLVGDGSSESPQTFKVEDRSGHSVTDISYEEGITFLGEWKYRQRAIAQTYDDNAKVYLTSTTGGEVDVAVSYGTAETATDYELDNGEKVGKELYTLAYYLPDDTKLDENAYVTVTAEHKTGYTFSGWYDGGGNLISKNTSYTYKVPDQNTVELYARFDPAGCDLKLNCSTYSNVEGDTQKNFKIYCFFTGLHEGKLYTLSYVSGSSVTNETFEADADGKATVILNMKHSDYAMFIYLPERCKYTIEADDISSAGFGVKGEVTNKTLTSPTGSQETTPEISEHIIFYKASQSTLLKDGKHYAGIDDGKDEITITQNSSYTFQVETKYNPSIYDNLSASLCFYDTNGVEKYFIDKTRILMIDLSNSATPKYYAYTVNNESNGEINAIPLTNFTELGSTGTNFTTKTGDMLTEKLVFIVDYVGTENLAESGKVSLVYDDANSEIKNFINPTKIAVNIGEDTTGIAADVGDGKASRGGPFVIDVTVSESNPAINTTYKEEGVSKYAVKLSLDGGKQLPDGSYAEVDGNKYFLGNGYIKIPSLTVRDYDYKVSVYTPVPVELTGGKVKFNLVLSDAVSASPTIPTISAKTSTTVEFTCVDVAMDADLSDKVLNPGTVSRTDVELDYKGIDTVELKVTKKNESNSLLSENIPLPTENNRITVPIEFTADLGETYIFSFIGYVKGIPVLEDKCCVVGGYVAKDN